MTYIQQSRHTDDFDNYRVINVETNAGNHYRIVIDVESDDVDELRLYKNNSREPFLRLEL